MSEILQELTIAKLLTQKGDYLEGRKAAAEARQTALLIPDHSQWIEATRIYFQCCQELEDTMAARTHIEEVLAFLRKSPDEKMQAQAETLIASWLLAQGKESESQDYIQSAIKKATQSRDLKTLTRALLILAFTQSLSATNYGNALITLEKLDVLLAEVANPEVQLTSYTLRGFIYTQKARFAEATDILWKSYEQAKLYGYYPLISSILAQLARVYRDQKQMEQFKIYAELALRGTDKEKMPRLHKLISAVCPQDLTTLRPSYDFQVDEASRQVREKDRGVIDFKNQHILYDLALLFLKNPGRRYSKEDLMEFIWKQPYDPDQHDNLIYVSIKRLRTLLEPDAESPRYILRDRKGYYLSQQAIVQFNHSEEAAL